MELCARLVSDPKVRVFVWSHCGGVWAGKSCPKRIGEALKDLGCLNLIQRKHLLFYQQCQSLSKFCCELEGPHSGKQLVKAAMPEFRGRTSIAELMLRVPELPVWTFHMNNTKLDRRFVYFDLLVKT